MSKKFIIAGGGTGGHIYPGIAIAKALETLNSSIEVEFVGSQMGLETKIVPREGFELHLLSAGKLNYRGSIFGKSLGLARVLLGFFQSFLLIFRLRPVGVLGVGGYASGPFVLAARLMGIPTAIFEPNAHPGLTNRWLSKIVNRSFVMFEEAKAHFKSSEMHLVGLPVRSELSNISPKSRESHFHVLTFGGSQGARALNEALENSVKEEAPWLHHAELIHQTGNSDYSRIHQTYANSVFPVQAFEYLFEMEKHYQWCDLVICRAGASTIAELCAVGRPAILVPLPTAADDHQRKNAMAMVEKRAAILLEQKDLTSEKINEIILELQKNPEQLQEMAKNAKDLYKPRAAETIAEILNRQI